MVTAGNNWGVTWDTIGHNETLMTDNKIMEKITNEYFAQIIRLWNNEYFAGFFLDINKRLTEILLIK